MGERVTGHLLVRARVKQLFDDVRRVPQRCGGSIGPGIVVIPVVWMPAMGWTGNLRVGASVDGLAVIKEQVPHNCPRGRDAVLLEQPQEIPNDVSRPAFKGPAVLAVGTVQASPGKLG